MYLFGLMNRWILPIKLRDDIKMDKRILLVSTQKSFMVNAMMKNLAGESYEVRQVVPKIREFSKMEDRPRTTLIYLDNDVEEMAEFLVYVKDRLIEDESEMRVYLVGNDEEIAEAKKILSERLIEGVFLRPLNVKELVEKLDEIVETEANEDRKKHILVVDDDGTMLRTLKLWLSDRYQVYMANSGMNAISLLAKKEVDLILLDYEMPVASGPQVLEMIRSEPATKDVPVMFLTAKNDRESVMSVMDLKPEKYLLKTMPPDVLLKNIDEFFAVRRMGE